MSLTHNNVAVNTATTGTGTMTLGSAVAANFLTEVEAGAVNGQGYHYRIDDGLNFEVGYGVYTSAGRTLTRAVVYNSKIGGTAGTTKLTLSGSAVVRLVVSAALFDAKEDLGFTTGRRVFTGTSDTLLATDVGKEVASNNAGANTVTVPPNSSVAIGVGAYINLAQYGAGQTTVAAGAGVTIRSRNGLKLAGQYAGASLRKIATDEWMLYGDLTT